nr:SEC14-like protein 2 isoform X1 [Parasteatoda tepidariorum]XP_042910446.1 SEC14-like protein 2 isoform X1 [Parasteatoda tepidariorum]
MIEIEDVTEYERKAIEELKRRIEHELTPTLLEDKSLYYRFLKARDFNIPHAEALIRKHMLIRKKFKVDEFILKDFEPNPILKEYLSSSFVGYDKEGSVVRYADAGNMDTKGLFSMFTFEEIAQYVAYYFLSDVDRLTEQSKKIRHGKKIPEELYLKQRSLINEKGVRKLNVTRSSFSEVMLLVHEPNTFIEWEFETASRSIGFGLFFKNESNSCMEIEELIELQRFEATLETGIYKCIKTGTYIVVFDNSFSCFHSKEIYYRIRLIKPNEESSNLN